MATDFFITAENNPERFRDVAPKDSIITYQFDASAWAENNNTISAATWTVKRGAAGISGQALANNVLSALVSLTDAGKPLIEVKIETGTETYITFLEILVKDPSIEASAGVFDYWWVW